MGKILYNEGGGAFPTLQRGGWGIHCPQNFFGLIFLCLYAQAAAQSSMPIMDVHNWAGDGVGRGGGHSFTRKFFLLVLRVSSSSIMSSTTVLYWETGY